MRALGSWWIKTEKTGTSEIQRERCSRASSQSPLLELRPGHLRWNCTEGLLVCLPLDVHHRWLTRPHRSLSSHDLGCCITNDQLPKMPCSHYWGKLGTACLMLCPRGLQEPLDWSQREGGLSLSYHASMWFTIRDPPPHLSCAPITNVILQKLLSSLPNSSLKRSTLEWSTEARGHLQNHNPGSEGGGHNGFPSTSLPVELRNEVCPVHLLPMRIWKSPASYLTLSSHLAHGISYSY